MNQAIDKIHSQMRPKIVAILRMRPHYDVKELVHQFKTHVWGIMEVHSGAIFHVSDYLLLRLDNSQRHFLEEIGLDEATAFAEFNFAPPRLRRNIGMLGLLHKRVLGISHPVFQSLLPFHTDVFGSARPDEHDKQLYGHILDVNFQHALHSRSIFGMVYVYNRLPQNVVDQPTVSAFQRCLTIMARDACNNGDLQWDQMFSCRL